MATLMDYYGYTSNGRDFFFLHSLIQYTSTQTHNFFTFRTKEFLESSTISKIQSLDSLKLFHIVCAFV